MNSELRTDEARWLVTWGNDWVLEGCAGCNGVFVLPPEKVSRRCPFCGQAALAQMDPTDDRPVYTQPPELVVPFRAAESQLRASVSKFAQSIWLAPADLNENALLSRMQSVYLPMWLVDVQVQGEWQAEMGFDYEIVSHREEYQHNKWQTERVKEQRVRWEQRLGRLNRRYENQAAPALEEQEQVAAKIGRFNLKESKPFQSDDLAGVIVHLPNRPPEDAWNEAVVVLKTAVSQDCRLASEADHTRGFKWSPHFANRQWTQLLLPIYTSYYLDDDNRAQMVLLHGQTGRLHGAKRASHEARPSRSRNHFGGCGRFAAAHPRAARSGLYAGRRRPGVGWIGWGVGSWCGGNGHYPSAIRLVHQQRTCQGVISSKKKSKITQIEKIWFFRNPRGTPRYGDEVE